DQLVDSITKKELHLSRERLYHSVSVCLGASWWCRRVSRGKGNSSEVNRMPRSEVNTSGQPRAIHDETSVLAIVENLMFLIGIASGQRVNRSIMVRHCLTETVLETIRIRQWSYDVNVNMLEAF